MKISDKKPNRYVALAAYLIAVICLLLGLFLPLFNGEVLAVKLPYIFQNIFKADINEFDGANPMLLNIVNFGGEGFNLNVMAVIVILYLVICALSVLALIPVAFSVKKNTRAYYILSLIVESVAAIIVTLYFVLALENYVNYSAYAEIEIGYNMIIALGGLFVTLIVLAVAVRGAAGFAKVVLAVLGGIALFMLFPVTGIIPELDAPMADLAESIKLHPFLYVVSSETFPMEVSGITFPQYLFSADFGGLLEMFTEAKDKAAVVLALIVGIAVIANFLIDLFSFATNARRTGYAFNLIRYAVEFAAVLCLIITVAAAGYGMGLLLVIIAVASLAQLVMSLIRYLMSRKAKNKALVDDIIEPVFRVPPRPVRPAQSAAPASKPEPVKTYEVGGQLGIIEGLPAPAAAAEEVAEAPLPLTEREGEEQLKIEENTVAAEPAPQPEVIKAEPVKIEEVAPVQNVPEKVTPAPAPVQSVPERVTPAPAPAPSVTEKAAPAPQPDVTTRIYTINTIYGGPEDEFIRKLSNDEKIEFAMTFIEKSKGDVGNIPQYVIGGNNKGFFSSVFIYLGRLRGMISDGLLNKMYKELNMM